MNMVAVSRRCRRGFTLVELLVVIAIIGVLVALMLPAVQTARASARRTQCFNNLKQYGLATNNFHQEYNRLPPFWSEGNLDKFPDGGWVMHLLPYMEQKAPYDIVTSKKRGQMTNTGVMTVPPSTDPPYSPPSSVNNGGYWQSVGTSQPSPTNHMGHTYPQAPVNNQIWVGPPNTPVPSTGTPAVYNYTQTGIYSITSISFPALHCLSDPSTISPSYKFAYGGLQWTTINYQANFLAWVKDADQRRVGVQYEVGGALLANADKPKMDSTMSYRDLTDGTSNIIMFSEGMRLCDKNYRLAFWNRYDLIANSHNFGVDWNGKGNTFMFQSQPNRLKCNNWRVQGLHFGQLAVCMFDGSVKALHKDISRRETSNPDFPTFGVDATFASSDPSFEYDGVWDRLMMPTDGTPLGNY
jgi:prepilin-type N-terminal cleavage/methylation domain-containing protein